MSTKKKITFFPSDWVTPAEAARIRGVTRQAIGKLISSRRIRTLGIAGRTLVNLQDVKGFQRIRPGRKKKKTS